MSTRHFFFDTAAEVLGRAGAHGRDRFDVSLYMSVTDSHTDMRVDLCHARALAEAVLMSTRLLYPAALTQNSTLQKSFVVH